MTQETMNKTYIDPEIPLEDQIVFLRRRLVRFQLDVYEVLKKELGGEGEALFKKILRRGYDRVGAIMASVSFRDIAKYAIYEEHIGGIESKIDSIDDEEIHWSITRCPILDGARQRGFEGPFCELIEEVVLEENSKLLGDFEAPLRMCRGDEKCTFVLRNTLGK